MQNSTTQHQPTIEPGKSRAVLIVQTAFLGDVLLSIPLLKNIRRLNSQSQIHYLCRRGLGQTLKNLKLIDEFYEVEKGNAQSYQQAVTQLRAVNFETIYCAHESFRSAWLVHQLRAKQKIAFRKWWNFIFFNMRVQKNSALPEALRQLQLLGTESDTLKAQLQEYAIKNPAGSLGEVPEWASMTVLQAESARKHICIFPGSVWATKKWTIQGFCEVAQELAKLYPVLLLGGPEDGELGRIIQENCPTVENHIGQTTLEQTLKILASAKLVITNDSGGQHLAALTATATVSIFGPTVLQFGYRPWNEKVAVVENKSVTCRPCGSHGHQQCPLATHECMKSITPAQVLKAAQEFL